MRLFALLSQAQSIMFGAEEIKIKKCNSTSKLSIITVIIIINMYKPHKHTLTIKCNRHRNENELLWIWGNFDEFWELVGFLKRFG